jgi:hypothetical protein
VSKAIPSAVNKFLSSNPTHQDHASTSSTSSSSFRTAPQTEQGSGTDADFGRFLQPAASSSSSQSSFDAPHPLAYTVSPTPFRIATLEPTDGADVLAFLADPDFYEKLNGDWEEELFTDQKTDWKVAMTRTAPLDRPLASWKGKERSEGSWEEEMETLSISEREYLTTLLSLPSDTSLATFLTGESYTDDVHGFPHAVRELLAEKKSQVEEPKEEGRAIAVRRLEALVKQLYSNALPTTNLAVLGSGESIATTKSKDAWNEDNAMRSLFAAASAANPQSTYAPPPSSFPPMESDHCCSIPARETSPWAGEYAIACQHIAHKRRPIVGAPTPVTAVPYNGGTASGEGYGYGGEQMNPFVRGDGFGRTDGDKASGRQP